MIKSFAHDTVDLLQNGNKKIVSTFVKHEGLADTMTKFIDNQTAYTKSIVDTNIDVVLSFGSLLTKKDFVKELAEAYNLDKFMPATSAKAASKKAK